MPEAAALAEALTRLVGAPVSLGFGAVLVVHIAAGLVCVIAGAIALLSPKQRGRHPRAGEIYYWALGVVFATATVLAVMRWAESGYLFFLGLAAFGAGSLGYAARKRRWHGWLTAHILGMSLSYIVLLTAFYVDNGPKLPIYDRLPPVAFWIGPSLIGLPLVVRTLRRRGRLRPFRWGNSLAVRIPRAFRTRVKPCAQCFYRHEHRQRPPDSGPSRVRGSQPRRSPRPGHR